MLTRNELVLEFWFMKLSLRNFLFVIRSVFYFLYLLILHRSDFYDYQGKFNASNDGLVKAYSESVVNV